MLVSLCRGGLEMNSIRLAIEFSISQMETGKLGRWIVCVVVRSAMCSRQWTNAELRDDTRTKEEK
jgi:hypothetical protein